MNAIAKKLANELEISELEVILFLADAPKKYRVYTIPKRRHGHRVIAQPSKKLKEYQRAFIKSHQFPIHTSAMAYRKRRSIKDNAHTHRNQRYLLKMDLENFFNSITPALFWKTWTTTFLPLPIDEARLIEKLLFWCPSKKTDGKLILSIGAPSSPTVSNFCLYLFDKSITEVCQELDIQHTRYADDLTFSTNHRDILSSIPSAVQHLLTTHFGHRLTINHSKTTFSSKAHNRHVTGITITNEGALSLGRERKRYIKHLVYQFQLDQLDQHEVKHLQGLLSFAKHIEPKFIISLKAKYSDAVILRIVRARYEESQQSNQASQT